MAVDYICWGHHIVSQYYGARCQFNFRCNPMIVCVNMTLTEVYIKRYHATIHTQSQCQWICSIFCSYWYCRLGSCYFTLDFCNLKERKFDLICTHTKKESRSEHWICIPLIADVRVSCSIRAAIWISDGREFNTSIANTILSSHSKNIIFSSFTFVPVS